MRNNKDFIGVFYFALQRICANFAKDSSRFHAKPTIPYHAPKKSEWTILLIIATKLKILQRNDRRTD